METIKCDDCECFVFFDVCLRKKKTVRMCQKLWKEMTCQGTPSVDSKDQRPQNRG